jgi:hypothetical protein
MRTTRLTSRLLSSHRRPSVVSMCGQRDMTLPGVRCPGLARLFLLMTTPRLPPW